MLAPPADFDAYAIDLRGFGESEMLPVDATRGLRDFSDDVRGVIEALGLGDAVDLVGWRMGAGVVLRYALDHPVRTLTPQAPVSPYGFGGTRGTDGERLTPDDPAVSAQVVRTPTSWPASRPATPAMWRRRRRARCTARQPA
ncbi:alpha/beta fold hydrolase [Occultella aeris]|uniref:Alpha/beta hydrolase family protein n=2 Tax=Occultella aeris TaxID=2761496 RepID=A0A7M4DSS4_9MICO|nr:Alpha/beta hydrolase family protein [Occultella aeris]